MKDIWDNIKTCLYIITFLVFLPIMFPLAMIALNIRDRQKQSSADKFRCTECGTILGTLGIQLADSKFSEYIDRLHEENPGWRLRIVKTIHGICSNCQAKFIYLEQEQTFKICTDDDRY
jgi:hypothetical protein